MDEERRHHFVHLCVQSGYHDVESMLFALEERSGLLTKSTDEAGTHVYTHVMKHKGWGGRRKISQILDGAPAQAGEI